MPYRRPEIGLQQKDIANQLGITPGGLSSELKRNGGKKKYDPDKADNRSQRLAQVLHVHYKYSDEVWADTETMLKEDFSPEQVVGRRGLEGKETPSVPSIYRHIKGRVEFRPHLRHGNKKYRERGTAKDRRSSITGLVSVDLRPAIVEEKRHFGNFEIDLINGAFHEGNNEITLYTPTIHGNVARTRI